MTRTIWSMLLVAWLSATLLVVIFSGREIFPFFSWALYTSVPQPTESYFALRVGKTGIDGDVEFLRAVDAPEMLKKPVNVASFELIQSLGWALERQDEPNVLQTRMRLEAVLFAPGVVYKVVEETGSIRNLWKGNPQKTRTIAHLTSHQF